MNSDSMTWVVQASTYKRYLGQLTVYPEQVGVKLPGKRLIASGSCDAMNAVVRLMLVKDAP